MRAIKRSCPPWLRVEENMYGMFQTVYITVEDEVRSIEFRSQVSECERWATIGAVKNEMEVEVAVRKAVKARLLG